VRKSRATAIVLALLVLTCRLDFGTTKGAVIPLHGFGAKILIVKNYALRAMLAQDPNASRFFAGHTTYVVNTVPLDSVIPRLAGTVDPTASYASYAAFAADVARGRQPRADHAVLYDIEKWAATPLDEQQHPLTYMAKFSRLARSHGLLPILAPARDLALVRGAYCAKNWGENLNEAYVRCGFASADAAAAMFVVQSQVDQSNPPLFRDFVTLAARQARAGNRQVKVIAQIATAPLGQVASVRQLETAMISARDVVDGFSLNVRISEIQPASELLRALAARAA
jgi:hypothetical protein